MAHYRCYTGKDFTSTPSNLKYIVAITLLSLIGTSTQEESCDHGSYTGNFSVITSPNYPSPYPIHLHCTYSIERDTPGPMSLRFIYFDLETHNSCGYDYIRIYDGDTTNDSLLLETLCGNTLPATVHTTTNKATILLHSDGSISGNGFEIVYGDPLSCTEEYPDGKCEPLGSCMEIGQVEAGALCAESDHICCIEDPLSTCGGTFEGNSGIIVSPNYPNEYTNNLDCVYVIKRPSGKVALTFLDFHLEAHGTCAFDTVEIYDGPDIRSSLIAVYCGDVAREAVSTGSAMTVRFHTDTSAVETGFKASWGEPDCPFWGGYCTQGACAIGYSNYSCSSGRCCMDQCDLWSNKICPDGTCIPLNTECDPNAHSQPGGIRCPAAGQICRDGSCISIAYQCPCSAWEVRCWDGSCASTSGFCPCTSYEDFQCMDGYGCYSADMRCNGVTDCLDTSDEFDCHDEDYYGSTTSTSWIYIVIGMFAVVIFVCILIGTMKRRHTQHRARRAATAHRMAQAIAAQSSMPMGDQHAYDNLGMMPPPAYGEAVTGPYPVAPPNYYNLQGPQSHPQTTVQFSASTPTAEECPPPYDSVSHITSGLVFLYGSAVPKPEPPAYTGEPQKDLPPYPGAPLAMPYNPLNMVPPAPSMMPTPAAPSVENGGDAVVPDARHTVAEPLDLQPTPDDAHNPGLDDMVHSSDAGTTLPVSDRNQGPGEFADVSQNTGATNYAFEEDLPSSTSTVAQPNASLDPDYDWTEEHYI